MTEERQESQESQSLGGVTLTLLVIEDDPARSLSVPELLDAAGNPIRVRTARNLTEAERLLTDDVHCILLDLALPAPGGHRNGRGRNNRTGRTDRTGRTVSGLPRPGEPDPEATPPGGTPAPATEELITLKHVLRIAPRQAVLALTATGDEERGAEAVRVGAQDYLLREELDGRLLSRAIRYAVERKRADIAQRQLTESKLRAQENARLERGLLPTPLLEGSKLRFAAHYRPGRSRALLGGDFYDTVRTLDGTVHAMIGDVCGHGPDEAALGVELRIAWRALTFAGLCGDHLLSTLQRVLEHERADEEIFATLCMVDIAPDGQSASLSLAGHPAPLVAPHGGRPELLPYDDNGPALGLLPNARWPRRKVHLGGAWSLMLYTDGLIEGRIDGGKQRLGEDGMVDMVGRQLAAGLSGEDLLEAAVSEVRELNGGELTDDVAVLLLDRLP
ncbi:PP2C family protein-serine/threonine phosphatase [Streptomyces sp. NPDC050560]|uniref:PP2C family protein-serine/threonine phosphatase n=1 Tax=Streptomyces sp. NPDC050560 TaxID=3365630 RepID=UPI0037B51C35